MIEEMMKNVNEVTPMIHCITNYVTVNDCANVVLAAKGSPIMADDVREVEDITTLCNALLLNIGTLNERTIEAMIKAGKKANELGHPVILDPVGVGASALRNQCVFQLLQEVRFDVIRGNVSEIKTIYAGSGTTKGVDADISDILTPENIEDALVSFQTLSKRTGAIIAVSGALDVVCDQTSAYVIKNGHPLMSSITGTGCQLASLMAVYVAANPSNKIDAICLSIAMMGYAGELGVKKMEALQTGSNSLRTYIIDEISKMDAEKMKGGIKLEQVKG